MKSISKDCGLPLKTISGVVFGIEVVFSLVVVALVTVSWTMDHHHPTMFIYEADLNDTYISRQRSLEGCVISWSLCILSVLSLWRLISAVILLLAIGKNSYRLLKYWIGFKILALVVSLFVAVVSFTSPVVKPSAGVSFILDFITSYFIVLLYPELNRMEKGLHTNTNTQE